MNTPANVPFIAGFSLDFLGVVKFHDAVGNSNNKTLSYQKLIGKGVSQQTLDTVSTKFEEKSPEQDFPGMLNNIDTANAPIAE